MHDRLLATAATVLLVGQPTVVVAQRANENAVASSDDAFGTNVGLETTGIYTENDTRGFSPLKAGNVRFDGVYIDPIGPVPGRARQSTAIRVGFASEGFPFPAPTGIVEHKLRPYPEELGTSLAYTRSAFGGTIAEWDLRIPVIKDHLGLTGGLAYGVQRATDGSGSHSAGITVRPMMKFGNAEINPFAYVGRFWANRPHPLAVVTGDFLPEFPRKRRYLGQDWAKGRYSNEYYGINAKAPLTDRLSLRGGIFHVVGDRKENFSEIFSLVDPSGLSTHRLISDPAQDIHTTSGEVQLAMRFGSDRWQHRLIAGYRARNRYTESGGSDVRNFGQVIYGQLDPETEPDFTYTAINKGRVRQSSLMLGYLGAVEGIAHINLGIQKARYRAKFHEGSTDLTTKSSDNPWLYNAMATFDVTKHLSLYAGTEKGLEDSGAAPENAANRNEQLPATRTTQYEGGVRWRLKAGQLVVNAFQITKPYFSFDNANRFEQVGQVRHRGVEASLSGHFGKRLTLLAGIVAMQPRVSGEARDLGLVGDRPAGTPSVYARIDATYQTDLFGGLMPTMAFTYTGKRAVGARPLASLDGDQLMLPAHPTLDLGLRQQFHFGRVPASFRVILYNIFDHATWKVLAANTLQVEERRRVVLMLAADF